MLEKRVIACGLAVLVKEYTEVFLLLLTLLEKSLRVFRKKESGGRKACLEGG